MKSELSHGTLVDIFIVWRVANTHEN